VVFSSVCLFAGVGFVFGDCGVSGVYEYPFAVASGV